MLALQTSMRFLPVLFFIYSTLLFGQTDRNDYLITIGKYSFRPKFIQDGKPGVKWEAGDDGDLSEYVVKYPIRSDTVNGFNAYGKSEKEIFTTWQFPIESFVDSINTHYLDTLLTQIVLLNYKRQPRQVYEMTFQIMYSDGKRLHKTVNSNKFADAITLTKKPSYSYLIISQIKFIGDNNQKLSIGDVIGWKIKYD